MLLVLRQDKELGADVVDLAKDPLAAGPLARSTTGVSNLDKALARSFLTTWGNTRPWLRDYPRFVFVGHVH